MATTKLVRVSHSPEETRSLGRSLAQRLAPGDLVCLYGDLGAGKTTFMQGLAEGLGSPEPATSPSFTLVHEHRGRVLLYHLDLYRLRGERRLRAEDLADAGIEEALRADAVVAVEWADRLPQHLRAAALEIHFDFDDADLPAGRKAGPNIRRLSFHALDARSARLVDELTRGSDACPCH